MRGEPGVLRLFSAVELTRFGVCIGWLIPYLNANLPLDHARQLSAHPEEGTGGLILLMSIKFHQNASSSGSQNAGGSEAHRR